MNVRPFLPFLLMILAVAPAAAPAAAANLPERFQKWIDEEVVYIITPAERDVFLALHTDRERDLFIDAFWKHRDPAPGSRENEFRKEHYRRIAYSNQHLGLDAPMPGWKTDRGRMYILLGEPQEIQKLSGKFGIYDCETWFYQGKPGQGLPSQFYLLFFKDQGEGMLKLYSPARDGPQALISGYGGDPNDYLKGYLALAQIDPRLADVAMSLVPGEAAGALGRPSLSSDILLQRIEALAEHTVPSAYARKFLEYKDTVEVEYSANYIDCDSLIKVFQEAPGLYFVHYAIEPQRLSLNQYVNKVYTTLRINGRITTPDGRLIHQFDKTISIDRPAAQMEEARRSAFDLYDAFPLVAGDYKLSLLVKNEVSKEFTSIEKTIRIPQEGPALRLTPPVLGYKTIRLDPSQKKVNPFQIGPYQILCQPGRIFTVKDTLAVAFQVNGRSDAAGSSGQVKIAISKDGLVVRDIARTFSEYPDFPNVLEEIPLAAFPPAHYKVEISLLGAGLTAQSAGEEFDLTFSESVRRPWFSSRLLPEPGDPVYDRILGTQLFNLGRFEEALPYDERASRAKPDSREAGYALAQVYLALGEEAKAIQTLTPFLDRPQGVTYEMYILAGRAFGKSGAYGKALEVLDQAVSHYGVNATILNAIGECYLGQKKISEALAAFQKSLQLSPEQPAIRAKVADLQPKK